MKHALLTIAAIALTILLGGAAVLYSGVYDIAAIEQHLGPIYRLLGTGMRQSVRARGRAIVVPPLDDPAQVERGLLLFDVHCVQCHGAPGIAPQPFALGLTPPAANLAYTAREWPPGDLYWVVRNGIRMTGMPAWAYRLSERDLWATVAFLRTLPGLTPQQYAQRLAGLDRRQPTLSADPPDGPPSAARGRVALHQYACLTCHEVPQTVSGDVPVGPPLTGVARRVLLSGTLPNTPENLVRWLRDPHAIDPGTAMPDLGVSERDARDIAAYLGEID